MLLRLALIFSFLLFLATLTIFPIEDADIWFHLATGRWIVENGYRVPQIDPFSWPLANLSLSSPTTSLMWEWGSEVALYWLYKLGGFEGIIVTKGLIIIFTFLLLLLFSFKMKVPIFYSLPLLMLGTVASADRFIERIEHIGNLFLVILSIYLFWVKRRLRQKSGHDFLLSKTFIFLVIPLLFLVWGNLHGSFILGLGVWWLFTIYLFFTRNSWFKSFLLGAIFSTITANLNPHGVFIYPHWLRWVGWGTTEGVYLTKIFEWQSPFTGFHQRQIYVQVFEILIILYWGLYFLNAWRGKASLVGFMLLTLITYLGITRVRHISIFFLLGFLPAVEGLGRENFQFSRFKETMISLIYLVTLIGGSLYIIKNGYQLGTSFRLFGLGVKPIIPTSAVSFLDQQKIAGNMLNQYEIGGYLIWSGFPQRKVFIDGRNHFPEWFFSEYLSMSESSARTKEILDKYDVDYVLVMYPEGTGNENVPNYLSESSEWSLVYWDDYYLLFLKRIDKFMPIIERFEYKYANPLEFSQADYLKKIEGTTGEILKKRAIVELERTTKDNPVNIRAHHLLGSIHESLGELKTAQDYYETALNLDPRNGLSYFLLGSFWLKKKEDSLARPELQRAIKFNPNLSFAYLLLGQMEHQEKNYKQAEKYYKKAIVRDPNIAQAYFGLGIIYASPIYQREKALNYLLKALELGLTDEQVLQAQEVLQRL